MRLVVVFLALFAAPAVLGQPGDSQRAGHEVAGCCGAGCSSGMCSADGEERAGCCGGGCCAGMHGEAGAEGAHEGHAEGQAGMSCCCAGMHGQMGEGHEGHHQMMHGSMTHGAAETPAHEAVRATINALFDAMRAGDGDALLATFHEGATLTSVGAGRDGVVAARREEIAGFAEAVSAPHPEPYDERIGPIEVRVDGPLATAWMTYRFHVGERFSHCGVNSFQLADTGDGWKILGVTDTRRPDCGDGE